MAVSKTDLDDASIPLSYFDEFHDAEFVHQAYRVILGRDPDSGGNDHYIGRIRKGYSKSEIAIALSDSPEGRSNNVKVIGKNRYKIFRGICKIPLVGRAFEGFTFLFFIREFNRDIRALENFTYRIDKFLRDN